jgi:hypothetical protein
MRILWCALAATRQLLATLESGINRAGTRAGSFVAKSRGGNMDTKPKYDTSTKPTDFDLETAIFGAP